MSKPPFTRSYTLNLLANGVHRDNSLVIVLVEARGGGRLAGMARRRAVNMPTATSLRRPHRNPRSAFSMETLNAVATGQALAARGQSVLVEGKPGLR